MIRLTFITGVIGSGKDHCAKDLLRIYKHHYTTKGFAYADIVKKYLSIFEKIPLHEKDFYEAWKTNPLNREKLIRTGLSMKETFGKECIAVATAETIKNHIEFCKKTSKDSEFNINIIITDLRFWYEFYPILGSLKKYLSAKEYKDLYDFSQAIIVNYKSPRYQIKDSPSEALPQWLIKKYPEERTNISLRMLTNDIEEFKILNPQYINELVN